MVGIIKKNVITGEPFSNLTLNIAVTWNSNDKASLWDLSYS